VLLGGPDEKSIAVEIGSASKQPLLSCIGNSLTESIALIEKCEMTVGGDSGLTHMARALGVPTVLIYGPTDHRVHSFGEKTKVLCARVKCRPCSRHGPRRCPERHHDCMRLVSPESVLEALREIASLQTPVPREERPQKLESASLGSPPA
jgi:ADP-heptose:LPS heptosyltransferase